MAIAYKARWYGANSVALTAAAGDYLFASHVNLVGAGGNDAITPPAGWTLIATRTWDASGAYLGRHSIYQKLVATGSEGTQTWTGVSSLVQETFVTSWSGVDTATGAEASAGTGAPGDGVTPIATSQNFASVTSLTANAIIIAQGFAADSSGGAGAGVWPTVGPAGYTAIVGTNYVAQFYKLQAAAGATGSLAVTLDSDVVAWSAWTLALKPGATQTLTPSLFTNSSTFYGPTINRGAVTLSPSLFTNPSTFYSPQINRGAVSLLPSLFTNSSTFYAATISQTGGSQTLTPARLDNSSTFYGAALSLGAVTLTPSRLDNASTFYGATVLPGVVTITPGLFTNASTFYGPTIIQAAGDQTLTPSLFTNTSLFYGATILQPSLQTLLPGLFTNASIFFLPTIANDNPGGTYPEAIEGDPTTIRRSLIGGGSVVAGSIPSTGRVIASALRGRP